MSNPWDDERRLAAARSLTRAALVTRIIGIVVVIGSVLTILTAIGSSSMGSSDRTGFSLVGLVTLVLGAIVWVNASFHSTMGRFLPTLVSLDRKLDRLAEIAERRAMLAVAPPVTAVAEATAGGEPAGGGPAGGGPAAVAGVAAPPPAVEPPPPPKVVVRPPPPEPERVPCPMCGGLVHPDATRCVHCMKKIKR